MIQYSKEHDEWLKKKAKDLSLRITNNKKNMTSTQKRLSGFVPNRTPRTATENYQITKSQKDTFRDKVYILFNNDQKLTNIFVGMYEEFYKNDDEMYVYFNITYNDLVKAFKGVVTRPETVLKTHEKLLNKFQNDDDDYDDQQTIFNSVNTSHTAHDFIRSYAPQESLYNNVPSSTMSLNQPVVDNNPSKPQGGIWPGYSSTKKKDVIRTRNSQSNNNVSDDVSVFGHDGVSTTENRDDDSEIDDFQDAQDDQNNQDDQDDSVLAVAEVIEDIIQQAEKYIDNNQKELIENVLTKAMEPIQNDDQDEVDEQHQLSDPNVSEFIYTATSFIDTIANDPLYKALKPGQLKALNGLITDYKMEKTEHVMKDVTTGETVTFYKYNDANNAVWTLADMCAEAIERQANSVAKMIATKAKNQEAKKEEELNEEQEALSALQL